MTGTPRPSDAAAATPPEPPSLATGATVEVMIPALDEAAQIGEAVANARRVGPVWVVDAGSTDETRERARDAGATVVQSPTRDFSGLKNWALDHLPSRAEWVLHMDADERLPPALASEILDAVGRPSRVQAYHLHRRIVFMGRAIRHGGLDPGMALRLFRRGRARYDGRAVHERLVCPGPVATLAAPMLHLRRGRISDYIERMIRYADLESDEWVARALACGAPAPGAPRDGRGGGQGLLRRTTLAGPVPGRALWRWFSMYVLRLGFLDGAPGWHLARLAAYYEYIFLLLYRDKLNRLSRTAGFPGPGAPHPPRQATAPPPDKALAG